MDKFQKKIKCGIAPLRLLAEDVLENLKTVQPNAIGLGCLEEIHCISLLLQMPYTLVIRHGEINSVLAKKHPPCWLAHTRRYSAGSWGTETHQQSYTEVNCNNDRHNKIWPWVQQWHNVMWLTNCLLLGFNIQSTGGSVWMMLQIWTRTCVWELLGPRGKPVLF